MDYGILGGGVAGLTAALRLAQHGQAVTIYEREPEPGGLAAGFRVGDAWLEKFYHHLFQTDTAMIGLIQEVGLGDRLVWPRPRTTMLRNGRQHQLDSPVSLLGFSPLSPVARLRMGAVLGLWKLLPNPDPLEGKRAAAWTRRWMGEAPYRVVWEPLLRGKFGNLAEDISLPWLWARVHDRTTRLGYVRGGFQLFYNRLAQRIADLGGQVRLGTAVQSVSREPAGGLRVVTAEGEHRHDRVISTLPTRLTCRLVPELPASYRERYDWGQAYGAHCLILSLDRQLTTSYWINISDPGFPFLALVEHTNYQPPGLYGGRHLIYLGNYRPMDDPLFKQDKSAVLDEFLPHLARINPDFRPEWVRESWVFQAPYAQPIVTVDYRHHIPPFDTPVPGLYVANMFQVYPHDRGQNYSVALADDLVRRLT